MADIAQAYFHFSRFNVDRLDEFADRLSSISTAAAQDIYDFELWIEIELIPGSLKGRVTASCKFIWPVVVVVSTYSGFKSSVKEIYADAPWFAGKVIEYVIKASEVQKDHIVRTERRTKAIGRLFRFMETLETIEERPSRIGGVPTAQDLARLERDFRLVQNSFDASELHNIEIGLNAIGSPPRQIIAEPGKFAIRPRGPSEVDEVSQFTVGTPTTYKLESQKALTSWPAVQFDNQTNGSMSLPAHLEQVPSKEAVIRRFLVPKRRRGS